MTIALLIVFAVLALGGALFCRFYHPKKEKDRVVLIGLIATGLFVCLAFYPALKLAHELYAEESITLGSWTMALGVLLLGTIVIGIIGRGPKPLIYADMAAFLIVVIAFIVCAIYLSKAVFQGPAAFA